MFNFKAAIFDLDGTIIDSMGIWEKIDIKFFEEINIPMPSDYIKIINNISKLKTFMLLFLIYFFVFSMETPFLTLYYKYKS